MRATGTRALRSAVGIVLTIAFGIGGTIPEVRIVHAANPVTQVLADGMEVVSNAIGATTALGELAQAIPLTGVSPALSDGLDVLNTLHDTLASLNDNTNAFLDEAPGAVAGELEALDVTTAGGVKIVFGCDGGSGCATPVTVSETDGGIVSISLPIAITTTISTPVRFQSTVVNLDGDPVDVALSASTTLDFTFDTTTATAQPQRAFAVAPFTVTYAAHLTGGPITASTRLGVADASATLRNLDVSLGLTQQFVDPDGAGGITVEELNNTTFDDLTNIGRTGSVAGTVEFDTDLIPGSPDSPQISIADANLADGYSFTLPALTDLSPFTLITPEAIVAGLGQSAAALGGAQALTDPALPFLKGTLRRLVAASRPVLDVVDSLGVVCGTSETDNGTPSGGADNLPSGTTVYCQATVTNPVQPGSVVWTAPNGTAGANTSGANADDTIGLSPTKSATFVTTADGDFEPTVTYTAAIDDDNNPATAAILHPNQKSQRPPRSVQQLAAKVAQLGGFDTPTDLVHYDPSTKALTFHITKTFQGTEVSLPLDAGDQLEADTGIAGLTATAGGIKATAKDIAIDFTPGVLLLPEDQWDTVTGPGGCPDPSLSAQDIADGKCVSAIDLFFVKVRTGAGEHEFSVGDASFVVDPPPVLHGQLGYLAVEATVAGSPAFGIARSDTSKPVLSVDLVPTGDMTVDGTALPGAIRLRELLFHVADHVDVSDLNLKLSGRLTVAASLNGSQIAQANVDIAWDPVFTGSPTITPDANFDGLFANFNPVPNLFGTHTAADSTTVLTNSTASFTDSAVGTTVDNVTDGSSCTVAVATATTLTCQQPLAGGTDNTWQSGDAYKVRVGSPLAMLEILLDNIDQITKVIQNLTGIDAATALDTKLPVVGISPRDLLQQIDDLRRALAEIKGSGASVQCGLEVVAGALSGDPSQVTLDSSGNGHIYCAGNTVKPALADPAPVWTVEMAPGSTATASVVAPTTPEHTVGNAPTEFVRIDFHGTAGDVLLQRQDVTGNDGSTSTVGYRVKVGWTDVDGAHAEEYPSLAQPNSIQKLQDAINEKLGVEDAFGLSFDTGPGGENLVVLDLGILRCNDGSLCDGNANMDPLSSSIDAEVDGLGGLVSAGSGGQVAVKYSAEARIKLGLELSGTPNIYVMPDTGIALKGRFEATDLDFDATLGPFSIKAGKSARIDTGGDSDPTNDVATGNGKVLLGADLTIGGAITSPVALGTFLTNLGTYLTPSFTAPAGPDKVCGTVDQDSDPNTDPVEVSGLGCALISVGVSAGSVTNYVADLGLAVDLSGGSFTITPIYPADLAAQFVNAALDLRLILNALPELIGEVRDGLRAGAASATGNGKVPLIGDALDAGADVADKLQQITTQLVQAIDPIVAAISQPGDIPAALRQFIFDQLNPTGLLQKPNGGAATADDIEVYVDCGGGLSPTDCDDNTLIQLKDVRVIFGIGQETDYELPFDLGLDGVPLRLAGSLRPHVGWNFVVDLGLSRELGPYIGVKKPTGTSSTRPDSELNLTAGVGFGANSAACSAVMPDPLEPLSGGSDPIIPGTWSEDRCLGGQLSFLGVQVRDGDGSDAKDTASHATINVGLDLSNGAADTLGFTNIGNVKLEPSVGVDAALNLRFRTGIAGDEPAGFPELVGTFHMAWNWAMNSPVTAPTVAFDDIYLNIEPLVSKFIEPIANEVRKITGPFKPVIDTLSAPIPVVSDLAEMVGQPPVTLLGLMQAISGNDLTLIQSLAAFIQFINDDKVANGYIPLAGVLGGGGFSVNGAGARLAQGPTEAAKLVQTAKAAAGSLFQQAPKQQTTGNLATSSSKAAPATKANLPGTFGVPGLTFPFMDNPSSIFGLLMGQDITLVRYDVGPLQASAGFSYNFPPIMVGPVPIAIGVGGSVTVKGRFVIGYDTSGLRKVLAGGSGVHLFDGIFLDDLDINGVDVPEISFIGEVYAQAGVSIAIASAGIVAGLRITVDLNLDDSPNPDGKLHIEEIFNKLSNPICLFDVKGSLTAFIKAYVELNLFITSLRYDFTLLELELLNFSGKCTPPAPKLAHWDGVKLVLNVGPYASQRNVDTENKDEEMTVRPAGGGKYSVSGFGLHQTYGPGGEFPSPDGYSVTIVEAHGDDGNDKFQMLPGTDESAPPTSTTNAEDTSIPFTAQALLYGDGDNDVLVGGDAVDTLDGGGGNDRVQGGKGGDNIAGGEGNDTLNGEPGNDTISGGGGDDQIQGGAGDDRADGGDGIDLLQGGPGTDKDPKTDPTATDGNDTLIGGPGPDTIEGGLGNDHLSGDAEENPTTVAECEGDTVLTPVDGVNYDDKISGGLGNDTVVGGLGNDELYGGAANDFVCGNQGNDRLDGDQNGDPKAGVPGDDIVAGGSGADVAVGGDGHDFVSGGSGADSVDGQGGNDDVVGGTGRDLVRGGAGRDILAGDTATIDQSVSKATRGEPGDSTSLVSGIDTTLDATAPTCTYDQGSADGADTAGRSDCLYGDDANDLIYGEGGNDAINAGEGDDLVYAGVGDDSPVHGDGGADTMYGEAGQDSMYGDSGSDVMYGNADADVMRGGSGDDLMEGNQAVDVMYGEGGQDDLIGGTSADGVSDGGDYIDGGASSDVIVGDNGAITRPGGNDPDDATSARRSVTVFDVGDPGVGGGDAITGGLANDRILGGNGDDVLWGEGGIDRIEGDDGSDTISGGTEGDRIAGGASSFATLVAGDGSTHVVYDAAPDTGDLVDGDGGDDVLAGDDATIAWDGVATMTTTDLGTNYGDDTLHGDDGQDRVFGQLGDDVLTGDADEDYVVGDLGAITPGAPEGFWPGGAPKWTVRLELSPDNGGIDTIDGGTADDHLYGGAADDVMAGGSGDDAMEGNGGQDAMYGWASGEESLPSGVTDQDDMIGGSSQATRPGDIARADEGELVMEGNADHDVMIGDNGDIVRVVAGSQWAPDEVITGAAKRIVTLLDRERADLTAVSGGDVMLGNTGSDRMFGEGGNDSVKGNEADDLLEGDQGSDWLEGNAGEDDLIGGSSFLASGGGLALAGAGADLGDPDDGDALFGGAGADVIAGDNAVVIRKTTANSTAYGAGLASAYFTTDPADAVPGWWLGVTTDRQVRLLDRSTFNSGRFGRDLVAGGAGADVAFGQDGGDWVSGGTDDDALEGNGGSDRIVGDAAPALDGTGGEPLLSIPPAPGSPALERDGATSPDGEDDIVGGSNVSHRDGSDDIAGNGEDDFVLGDNGTLQRNIVGGAYVRYAGDGATHDRYMRRAVRLDVNGAAGVFGNDTVRGNAGDDAVWGQDGNDTVYGGAGDDDLLGELGDDSIFGGLGEDAILGDRGSIRNTELGAPGAQFANPVYTFNSNGPPFLTYTGFRAGTYDRRVDLMKELPGSVGGPFTGAAVNLAANGVATGGSDRLRGGPGHDNLHGASGDDLMNGDSGGDTLFGGNGSDVMWGGRGNPNTATPDDRGANDQYVDYLFGGRGGDPATGFGVVTGGADIMDYLPRPGIDPDTWFQTIAAYDDGESGGETSRQHHQGVDWFYGGWDRDVMESNLADNGPNPGDRAIDWTGSYNLYVQCPAANGGYNDQRVQSPAMIAFEENLAYSLGVGASLAEVQSSSSSAYNELAMVYKPDIKSNSGSAYPTTPGHFENPTACTND